MKKMVCLEKIIQICVAELFLFSTPSITSAPLRLAILRSIYSQCKLKCVADVTRSGDEVLICMERDFKKGLKRL